MKEATCECCRAVLDAAGATLWCRREDDLDAVTAISGSGPAYVFYFLEALEQAKSDLERLERQAAAFDPALGMDNYTRQVATTLDRAGVEDAC